MQRFLIIEYSWVCQNQVVPAVFCMKEYMAENSSKWLKTPKACHDNYLTKSSQHAVNTKNYPILLQLSKSVLAYNTKKKGRCYVWMGIIANVCQLETALITLLRHLPVYRFFCIILVTIFYIIKITKTDFWKDRMCLFLYSEVMTSILFPGHPYLESATALSNKQTVYCIRWLT